MQSKEYKSIRIFKSDALERLTHVHPLTPMILWVPIVSWFIVKSWNNPELNFIWIGALLASGLLFWTITEYVLHRIVFHFVPHGTIQEKIQYLIHGLHHADPQDPTRLVMPPVPAIILASLLYGLFRLALGGSFVDPFFAGFMIGYLCYDYIHFYVHHFTPKTRLGKYLKQSHMIHHYVDPNARWGVSSPLWDLVFGTMGESKRPSNRPA